MRRVLEICGNGAGVPCLMLAVNDEFVVPVPMTMRPVAFFQPTSAAVIASELREGVAQRLANGSGWTAVAAGAGGRVRIAVGAANEQAATSGAMTDCSKQDTACRVIAIGPFAVEPK